MVVTRDLGERGMESYCLMGTMKFQFEMMEKFWNWTEVMVHNDAEHWEIQGFFLR